MKKQLKNFSISAGFIFAFILWTIAVCYVDVNGPQNSSVGLAYINRFIHDLTGTNFSLYLITDWLGLVPVAVCFAFAILGLVQWIKRKKS